MQRIPLFTPPLGTRPAYFWCLLFFKENPDVSLRPILCNFVAAILALLFVHTASAREGMWLPTMLKAREAEMRKMGLKIPVEKLYAPDGTALNAAVVRFGSGCTGEIISNQGLLLTNHHCGYGTVQGLSSRQADYFAQGFWAMNNAQEIPCPGLTAMFVRKVEDVTARVLAGIHDTLRGPARDTLIAGRIARIEESYNRLNPGMEASIRPHYNGNQYWVQVTETFKDVRLVGFPPNGIGQFGGDTDNWMWPRHTGDFSLFRIYADSANRAVEYSPKNRPYKAKQFFTINAGGIKEGDFTMVYGFPGMTQEYLSSPQLSQIQSIQDPVRVDIRTRKLGVWTERMKADRDVFLKYTSKRAGVANAWKKWQGELRGLRMNDVVGQKRAEEDKFARWAAADESAPWADVLLPQMQALSSASDSAILVEVYLQEAVLGVELLSQGPALERLLGAVRSGSTDSVRKVAAGFAGFFKNYDAGTDEALFATLMPHFFNSAPAYVPATWRSELARHDLDFKKWARDIWSTSILGDTTRFAAFVENPSVSRLEADPALRLFHDVQTLRRERIYPIVRNYNEQMAYLNRLYMAAQMKADSANADFYPDANGTLRLAYGQVKGIDPEGPAPYSFQTNLDEAIAKDNPAVDEFRVPEKLKVLHTREDFGRWEDEDVDGKKGGDGTVPIAFIADNHTTGGNSGSPVLNARGELIGTNFDRIWEGTMSDLYFDPRLSRNISLDIRYTLFVVEKFGGAGWLLKEMKIVR